MANTALGRTEVALLTNKSGGSVAQGDVVIIDTANASAFTTTTTSAYVSGMIGVVLEPNGIANNAIGIVALGGYVPVINLSGTGSIGDLVKTHTVAKQGVRHTAPQVAGDFAQVLATSATPSGLLFGTVQLGAGSGGSSPTLYSTGTRVDIKNDATEQTVLSYSVPGGTLGSANALRVTIQARIIHSIAGTLTVRFKYGATTLLTITVTEGAVTADKSADIWFLLTANGATNAQRVSGRVDLQDQIGNASTNPGAGIYSRWNQEGTATEDSTAAKTLAVTVQWGSASNSLEYDQSWAGIEKLG